MVMAKSIEASLGKKQIHSDRIPTCVQIPISQRDAGRILGQMVIAVV